MSKEFVSGSKRDGFDFDVCVEDYEDGNYGSYIEIEDCWEPGNNAFHIHIMGNYQYSNSPKMALRKSWQEASSMLQRVQKALGEIMLDSLEKLDAGHSS